MRPEKYKDIVFKTKYYLGRVMTKKGNDNITLESNLPQNKLNFSLNGMLRSFLQLRRR